MKLAERTFSTKKIMIILALVLAAVLSQGLCSNAFAADNAQLDAAVNDTASYMYKTVAAPEVGSIGGEWAVLGLARSGYNVPAAYYNDYYNRVVDYVLVNQGVLSERKYTEYSRVILALTAIGKDPANVGGYNLLVPLGDFNNTVFQGINGAIFALIAVNSGDYEIPKNSSAEVQATEKMYIDFILNRQLADGGWNLSEAAATADTDVTAMALQALAHYKDQSNVKTAIDKAVACLSAMQRSDGGFASWGTANCESTAQVIVALGELGISLDDSRFVKNGNTLLDNLLKFYTKGGGFTHVLSGTNGNNQMSTEQGFYALVSAQRAAKGQNSLYNMTDVKNPTPTPDNNGGLSGKNPDVKKMPVVNAGKTFADVKNHANQSAIEALAARGIINGMTDTAFEPNSSMTRAEFATIVVRGLGLSAKEVNVFRDVKSGAWYSGYIGAAYSYGIVNGTSATEFTPNSTITKEEAAAMVARAAKLCGLNTELSESEIKSALAGFADNGKISAWAKPTLAYCVNSGIIGKTENIQPQKAILRCEIAQMLYNMLGLAELL